MLEGGRGAGGIASNSHPVDRGSYKEVVSLVRGAEKIIAQVCEPKPSFIYMPDSLLCSKAEAFTDYNRWHNFALTAIFEWTKK